MPHDSDIKALRKYTVLVFLALLAFVVVGDFFDDVFFGNKFHPDPAFFTLCGGMITGIFSAEVIKAARGGTGSRKDDDA
jgi:hypothetical protein